MNPSSFDYYRPDTVSEAIALLQEHGENVKLLAGAPQPFADHETAPVEPDALIDLGRIGALRGVAEDSRRPQHRRAYHTPPDRHPIPWFDRRAPLPTRDRQP